MVIQKGKTRSEDGKYCKRGRIAILGLMIVTSTVSLYGTLYNLTNQKLISPLSDPILVYANNEYTPSLKLHHDVEFTTDQVVDYIWYRESGRGKFNPPYSLASNCYIKGMINEWGFGGMQNPKCFKTRQEGVETITNWIKSYLKKYDGDIVKTLCMYNVGLSNNCEYGTTFLKEHTYDKE
jgi:hypothetical protein